MNIQEERNGAVLTVKPDGNLDTVSSGNLEEFLQDKYEGFQQIIIDFSNVDYIASSGLRVLILAHKKMKEKDGLLLRNVGEHVKEVFTLTGYIHVLKIEE